MKYKQTFAGLILATLFLLGHETLALPQDARQSEANWLMKKLELDVTVHPHTTSDATTSEGPYLTINGSMQLQLQGGSSRTIELWANENHTFKRVSVEGNHQARIETARGSCSLSFSSDFEPHAVVNVTFSCELEAEARAIQVQPDIAFCLSKMGWYPSPATSPDLAVCTSLAAPGKTTLHLPPGWNGWTQGQLVSRNEDSNGVHETWELDKPVARSLAGGPFVCFTKRQNDRSVSIITREGTPNVPANAEFLFRMRSELEKKFGPNVFSELDFAMIEIPDRYVNSFYAVADPAVVFARSQAFTVENGNLQTISHEFGHGWWGIEVGIEGPGRLFLSEGLAQYCAVMALELIEPDTVTDFLEIGRRTTGPRQHATGYFEYCRAGRDEAISETVRGGHLVATSKGVWVYHMLRRRVGDRVFFATLKKIAADYRGRNLTLPKFRQIFVEAAPDAGLEQFFAQWLEQPGAPILELEWEHGDSEAIVRQVQTGDPYALDLELGITTSSSNEIRTDIQTVKMMGTELRVQLPAGADVTAVMLDPRKRILMWRAAYGPRPDQQTVNPR